MRQVLDTLLSRFWLKLAEFSLGSNQPAPRHVRPEDEPRLLQALIDMNAVLARAARF